MITVEEALAMRGTEFTYYDKDGSYIKAFVKEFDPKVGLSCYTLETCFNDGWKPNMVGEDGSFCVIGCHIGKNSTLEEALEKLTVIKETGQYTYRQCYNKASEYTFLNGPKCAFT